MDLERLAEVLALLERKGYALVELRDDGIRVLPIAAARTAVADEEPDTDPANVDEATQSQEGMDMLLRSSGSGFRPMVRKTKPEPF